MYPTRTTFCNRLISSGDQFRGHHTQFSELGMVSPELSIWWETSPATTPCQKLGMVSPQLPDTDVYPAGRARQDQRIADAQFKAVALPNAAQAAGGRADIIARLGRRALEEVEGDAEFGEGRHGNT